MSKWISIKRPKPEEGTEVELCTLEHGIIKGPYWVDDSGCFVDENMIHPEDEGYNPTHFYITEVIPEPPTA